MLLTAGKSRYDLGVMQWDDDDRVSGYLEKPTTDYTVSMGYICLRTARTDYIPVGKYLDFPDLILKLIANGREGVRLYF